MTDISYQLYSSRNFPPLKDTLHMLAEFGYAQVEGYGAMIEDPDLVAALKTGLQETGLSMPTCHVGVEALENAPTEIVSMLQSLGVKAALGPYLAADERPKDADGWRAFGHRLAAAAAPVWDAGMVYGWHNHEFEFDQVDGAYPLDLILEADPRLMLELDLAWVVRGGEDPLHWLAKYGDRLISVHIKDLAPAGGNPDEDGWADVGHGTMDWSALLGAIAQTSAKYLIVEHDNPSDHRRFAANSIATIKTL